MVKPEIVGRVLTEYLERKVLTQDVLSGLAGLDRTLALWSSRRLRRRRFSEVHSSNI